MSAAPTLAHERNDGFWWMQVGEQSAAVVNFGPTFATPEGPMRQWSLVVHLPGGDEPLSCTQGLVSLAEAYPILTQGESFRIELRPCEGCRWGDVTSEAQIVAEAQGLF